MIETNKIYCGDSLELLKQLDSSTIDLVVTSPPYDTLRKYGQKESQWNEETFQGIAKELYRVLKEGGVIVWVVNDKVENGSKTGTSLKQALYFKEIGFNINDYMIWRKTNPMPQVKQKRYNSVFEFMLILSKGQPKTFNPIMVDCKCADLEYKSTVKNMGGENGRTKKEFSINKQKVADNIWDIAVAQNKTDHPAVYPLEIPLRHIQSWSNEGDIVLDPFMGSGTTGLAAKMLNRQYIGFEINQHYCDIAREKIGE